MITFAFLADSTTFDSVSLFCRFHQLFHIHDPISDVLAVSLSTRPADRPHRERKARRAGQCLCLSSAVSHPPMNWPWPVAFEIFTVSSSIHRLLLFSLFYSSFHSLSKGDSPILISGSLTLKLKLKKLMSQIIAAHKREHTHLLIFLKGCRRPSKMKIKLVTKSCD